MLRQQQGIYLFFTKHIVAFDDIEYIKDLSEGTKNWQNLSYTITYSPKFSALSLPWVVWGLDMRQIGFYRYILYPLFKGQINLEFNIIWVPTPITSST